MTRKAFDENATKPDRSQSTPVPAAMSGNRRRPSERAHYSDELPAHRVELRCDDAAARMDEQLKLGMRHRQVGDRWCLRSRVVYGGQQRVP
jgi:hypothetical protein